MSLIPLFDELYGFRRPMDLFDQHFGSGLLHDDIYTPSFVSRRPALSALYLRPLRHLSHDASGASRMKNTKDGFEVSLDVQQFKPEEISVKVVDNSVVVEGKHEEREDEHGYVRREFTRRYMLPKDVDANTVASSLSSDGVLTLHATKKALPAPQGERNISITHTNAPAIKHQEKRQGTGDDKMEQ